MNKEDFCLLETRSAAWVDEDDSNVRVDITSENRLKKFRDGGGDTISGDTLKKKLETQFVKIYGLPSWASETIRSTIKLDEEEDQDDNEILQHAGSYISKKMNHLPKGIIDISKLKDANCSKPFDVSEVFYLFMYSS
mgnify:FL=1